ncbi:MAG: DNA double-strand break repair nuclease NurA [Candidatus Micrarchaeota archaeon]|nr:DNA double-strand break repair nuclease NurA [Candidatus Micrarchaeota archaeon]
MPGSIDEIAKRIAEGEGIRAKLALHLRANSGKTDYPETLEKELHYPVKQITVNGKIAAVDSGIAGEELHGFDFLVMRSVGALFDYKNSQISSHCHFPSALPPLDYDIRSGLDSHDVIWHKSLFRLKGELSCALSLMKKHSPTALLMDGSIAPLLSDKPSEDSEMRPLYDDVLAAYKGLYEEAWNSNTSLIGVIKDSRSKRFIEILRRHAEN